MVMKRLSAAALLATMLLGGCAWFEDTAVPVMTGETLGDSFDTDSTVPVATLPHGGVTSYDSSGTTAGDEAAALRDELGAVKSSADSAYALAQRAMAGVASDLGLYQQAAAAGESADADSQLQSASARIGDMTAAVDEFAAASARIEELRARAQAAYNMGDVSDEDREQLSVLEGEINRTGAVIAQASDELNAQITRHNQALTRVGQSGVTAMTSSDLPIAGPILPAPGVQAGTRPFITIRFDNADAPYQSEVATAMNQAMSRRPDALFDVVAVTPNVGSAADVRRNTRMAQDSADGVLRFITSLGVHPDRTTISSTTSDAVGANEVHIYIR
jgi:hypothetical protein